MYKKRPCFFPQNGINRNCAEFPFPGGRGVLLYRSHIGTVEPPYNEPLHNEVLGITSDFLYPSNSKIMKKNLDITKPRHCEQIFPVPWRFVTSRFHCMCCPKGYVVFALFWSEDGYRLYPCWSGIGYGSWRELWE